MRMTKSLLALCLAASLLPAAAAETGYLSAPAKLSGTPNADYLGKADAGAPVEVLERKDGAAKVRISGWALKEYPSQIFTKPGVRIENASLDEESAVKLDEKAGSQTVQDNLWVRASAEGWVDAALISNDRNALWKKAEERQHEACSSCHSAPSPDKFTANQWAGTIPERGGRAGHTRKGANALMFRWMQEHAKPM
jgi:hypothetical protein